LLYYSFLMSLRSPRPTLFPYTTLFRSHPDDPPYLILGLPRIAGNVADFEYIVNTVDKPFNGVCFCTGSLGAGPDNNLVEIFNKRSEEHTSELQSRENLVCRLLLEKKNI